MNDTGFVLAGLFGLLSLGCILSVILAGSSEWHTRKALQSYGQFLKSKKRLAELETYLEQEALRWPIYTRPVLFTPVDKKTQRTFGISQQTLAEAQEIAREFPSAPLYPEAFRDIFSPRQCLERIQHCRAILQQESALNQRLARLEAGKKAFEQSYGEETKTCKDVERQLGKLKERLSKAEQKMASMAHGAGFNAAIGWVISYAQTGFHASEQRLAAPKQKGLLNYAIADTFIRLTNYLLDHFDLSETEIPFSGKFILDRFENRLRDFEINLRKVIEAKQESEPLPEPGFAHSEALHNQEIGSIALTARKTRQGTYQQAASAIETWDDVAFLDGLLVILRKKLEAARDSFSFFTKSQTILRDLASKINAINRAQVQEDSLRLEAECARYWGAFDDFPFHWQEALKEARLPHFEYQAANQWFLDKLQRPLKPETKIRQSEMTVLISHMTCFLATAERGKTSFDRLLNHLQWHKEKEIVVNGRLRSGTTAQMIADMESITNDYSPDNRRACAQHRGEYNGFLERARRVTGANFPAMLGELDAFEKKCRSLMDRHNEEIRGLHQRCEASVAEIHARLETIQKYKAAVPKIKFDFNAIETWLKAALQKKYISNFNYQWLQEYLKETGDVIDESNRVLAQVKAIWDQFVEAEKTAYQLIGNNKALLDGYQDEFSKSWNWVKAESAGIIESAKKETENLTTLLSNNRDRQFSLSTEDAIQNCRGIEARIQAVNTRYLGKLEEIRQQQDGYLESHTALVDMVDRPQPPIYRMFQRKPQAPEELKELCSLATQVYQRKQVEYWLDLAEAYIKESVTKEQVVEKIQQFNNTYINQGVVIGEQNNQPGSTAYNAGGNINN